MTPERAVVDVRLYVEGLDAAHVFALISRFVSEAHRIAPPGVDVRYTTLRPARTSPFQPTIVPRKRG